MSDTTQSSSSPCVDAGLLEMLVEQRLIDALADVAAKHRVTIQGFWQPAPDGEVKTSDSAKDDILLISVSPRGFNAYHTPIAEMSGKITLSVLASNSADGGKVSRAFAHVMRKMMEWYQSFDLVREELTVKDVFEADGFILSGGTSSIRQDGQEWAATQTFTIKGRVINQKEEP